MPKVWSSIRKHPRWQQRGFLSLEVMLASVVFGFLTIAVVGAIIYGQQATARAGDYDRAMAMAEEGVEAVRNIRDADFANLANGTHGLAQSGGQWVLSGSSDINGIFTRQIVIGEVDGDRKSVISTVSWTINGVARSVSATGRLTDWQAALTPPAVPGPIMMAYSKTTATPFYRIWDGSAWGAEGSASNVTGNINYVVLKSSRTRDEAILGTQTASGVISVQVWNGSSWSLPTQLSGAAATGTRTFDIAYEKNSDRAIVVYSQSSGSADFAYRIWDGSNWLTAVNVNAMPTTGAINWIEIKQNPLSSSDEIAMIMLDANSDVFGMVWTGSAWSTMGQVLPWDINATTSVAKKGIDVEYEQTSGEALFVWGDSVSTDQYYRTWNGTTLGSVTLLDIAAAGGISEWIQLAARPNSNEIMLGVQDAGADLNTRKWSGSGWDAAAQHAEHDATTENITSRNFDIVWETHSSNPGEAWLVWGDQATVSVKQWSGTAWGSASVLSGSDDTSFVRLRADPVSGAVFSGNYQCSCSAGSQRNINMRSLTGGSSAWSSASVIWGGQTSADPVHFRIDIAMP